MIAYIEGKIIEKTPTYVVIDNNGIGYLLNISLNTYSMIKDLDKCNLKVYHAIKGESSLSFNMVLYGFFDEIEKNLFTLLITVPSVGLNTARMMLSTFSPEEIQNAIMSNNLSLLQSIKGIGNKTAQKIILELKDKIAKTGIVTGISISMNEAIKEESILALKMLGFNKNEIERAIIKVEKTIGIITDVEQLIKETLKHL